MSESKCILLLAGDGIGPEVIAEAVKLIECLQADGFAIEYREALIGGAAYDVHGKPLPDETLEAAEACDALLMGAVGAPQYEKTCAGVASGEGAIGYPQGFGFICQFETGTVVQTASDSFQFACRVDRGT